MAFGNQYGVDLGAIGNAWAQEDQNSLRKMLGEYQVKQMKREEENANTLKNFLPRAMTGDEEAMGQVTAASPQLGVSLMNQRRTLADKDRELFQKQAPAIIKLFGDVKDEGTYQQRRQAAIQSGIAGAEKFPPVFDPNFLGRLTQTAMAFAPERAPIFQDLPMDGDRIQRQMSRDNGQTWEPYGRPYDRRDPMVIQDIHQDDGSVVRAAVPRASFGRPAGQATPQAPGGAPAAPGQPALPAGSTPISVTPVKRTDEQNKAAGFADRLAQSLGEIDKYESAGLSLRDRAASNIPVLGNFAVSNEYQQLDQAQRDFINAVLRRESGAVIAESEFDNARKQYFPQPGDSKETLEQKYRNRLAAYEGMKRSAGQGYKPTAEYKGRAPTGGVPQPGHTEDGYRFKGGNPADPNSWEKL